MPDNPGAADPQAGATAQPQAGTSSTGQAPGAQSAQPNGAAAASGTGEPTDARIATLERELAEARREAARHRTENQRLTQAQQAAVRSEADRIADLEKRLAEADSREREASVTSAITAAATRLGFRNPELAAPLVRAQVQLDDDGRPKNLDTLLKNVLQRDPYLARAAPDFGGGNRGSAPQGTDMNALIRQRLGRA